MGIFKRLIVIAGILGITIGALYYFNILKKPLPIPQKISLNPNILGENISIEPTMESQINEFVGNTFQSTKETVNQKVEEVQKTVIQTLENQVTQLTQSQITAFKTQICRDWGVLSPSSSPSQ